MVLRQPVHNSQMSGTGGDWAPWGLHTIEGHFFLWGLTFRVPFLPGQWCLVGAFQRGGGESPLYGAVGSRSKSFCLQKSCFQALYSHAGAVTRD